MINSLPCMYHSALRSYVLRNVMYMVNSSLCYTLGGLKCNAYHTDIFVEKSSSYNFREESKTISH